MHIIYIIIIAFPTSKTNTKQGRLSPLIKNGLHSSSVSPAHARRGLTSCYHVVERHGNSIDLPGKVNMYNNNIRTCTYTLGECNPFLMSGESLPCLIFVFEVGNAIIIMYVIYKGKKGWIDPYNTVTVVVLCVCTCMCLSVTTLAATSVVSTLKMR